VGFFYSLFGVFMGNYHSRSICFLFSVLFVSGVLAQLPEVSAEAIEALGVTPGTPKRNGFVFIEGRYLSPPYTVSRKGNAIFINRIQVEQPIAWTAEALTPSAVPLPKKVDPPKKIEPEKLSPFAPAPESSEIVAVPETQVVTPEPAGTAPQVGKTLDALFDEPVTNTVTGKDNVTPDKKVPPVVLTQKQKEELRQKLDAIRLRFELGLGQGEIYFFSHKNGRVNGTYGTGRALFMVLPEALRYAQSPQDLLSKLYQGGVSFLDINACTDLYRHKLNFMVLSARREMIKLNEEAKKEQSY
jgi:hypothetical protein